MSTSLEITEFEDRVQKSGITIADVLRKAGIDRSMWTRWKNGTTTPRLDNWRAVERAADALATSQEKAGAA